MDVGVGVGRSVVKDKLLGAGAILTDQLVQLQLRPFLETRRLVLRQIRLLREAGFWEIDCLFQVKGVSRHKLLGRKNH
jgi:hypothetical protein